MSLSRFVRPLLLNRVHIPYARKQSTTSNTATNAPTGDNLSVQSAASTSTRSATGSQEVPITSAEQQLPSQQSSSEYSGLQSRGERGNELRNWGTIMDPFRMVDQMTRNMLAPFGGAFTDPFRMFDQMTRNLFGPSSSLMPSHATDLFPERALLDFNTELSRPVRFELDENEKEFLLTVKAPDMKKQDLHLEVKNDTLLLSGQSNIEKKSKRRQFQRNISFQRAMVLPADVDAGKISAKFDDGKLKITLPKTPKAMEESKKSEIPIE